MLAWSALTTYGQILAERRRRFGFAVEEVARLAGVSPGEVTAIEAGTERVTMHQLEALGRALVFDPAALLRGETPPDARRLPGWFRSHAPDSPEAVPASDVRVLALAAELGEIGEFLRGLVGEPTLCLAALRSTAPIEDHEHAWRQGYELGARARARLEELDPSAGACDPLRSVQQTLERLGVHVASVALESWAHQAVSVWRPGAMPVVLLNVASDRVRRPLSRRAVLAHELAHLTHDGGENDLAPSERLPRPHAVIVEQRANAFAPAFLAPPACLRERIARHGSAKEIVLQVAREWGFTLEGAIWHAKNTDLIDAACSEALMLDISWRSASTRVSGSWEPELARDDPRDHGLDVDTSPLVGGLLQDLALRAYRSGAISAGRTREILTLS